MAQFTYLTLDDFRELCFTLTQEILGLNQPIPEFDTRYPGSLESILSLPQQNVFGKELYDDVYKKAACYFYFICKNHPFKNGNKRLAIVTTFVFLKLNNLTFKSPLEEMYIFAIKLSHPTTNHEKEFKEVVEFIKRYSH